jgi:DNA polymerase I-like protein with 3'-5' exonuclease and polymerase domains
MPTDQERLASLEHGVDDLNHHVTMIEGMVTDQERDIKAVLSRLDSMGIRLDGMDAHLETLSQQMQEQFAATNTSVAALSQRFDVSVTAMNQRLSTIIALLTGGTQPKPPEK